MINPLNDELLTLAEAARMLPRRPNLCTLWRWASKGIKGIRLETVSVGGRRYTTRTALADFFRRTSEAGDCESPTTPRTSAQRQRAVTEARKVLSKSGIGGTL